MRTVVRTSSVHSSHSDAVMWTTTWDRSPLRVKPAGSCGRKRQHRRNRQTPTCLMRSMKLPFYVRKVPCYVILKMELAKII